MARRSMKNEPSLKHFQEVVGRIRKNSWFSKTVLDDRLEFRFTVDNTNGTVSITEVPSEAFDSLLLNVRKLTMNESPEQLHSVCNKLKQCAASDADRALLDVWHKYWRLAFIKEPFLLEKKTDHVVR